MVDDEVDVCEDEVDVEDVMVESLDQGGFDERVDMDEGGIVEGREGAGVDAAAGLDSVTKRVCVGVVECVGVCVYGWLCVCVDGWVGKGGL